MKRPPRLWNFFSGKPKYTSKVYPDDMDTTALGLIIFDYSEEIAHSILDEMLNCVNEEGLVQVQSSSSKLSSFDKPLTQLDLHRQVQAPSRRSHCP